MSLASAGCSGQGGQSSSLCQGLSSAAWEAELRLLSLPKVSQAPLGAAAPSPADPRDGLNTYLHPVLALSLPEGNYSKAQGFVSRANVPGKEKLLGLGLQEWWRALVQDLLGKSIFPSGLE